MKKVLFLGCVILMQSLFGYSQFFKTLRYQLDLIKWLKRQSYISYTVEQEDFDKDGESFPRLYSISFDRSVKKNLVCYCFGVRYSRLDKDSIVYIDPVYEEIHTYRSDWETKKGMAFDVVEVDSNPYKNFAYYQLNNFYGDDLFFSYSLGRDLMLYVDRIVKDTVMGGSHCKVYIGRSSTKKTLISDTCWTPLYHSDVVVYYNKDKQWVDSVVTSLPRDVDEVVRENVVITNFEDKTAEYDSIFSERNPVYAIYEHLDDSKPYGENYSSPKPRTEKVLDRLTDDILEHPFVDVNGDTTTLGQQEGWVLIETWYDGCRPCKQWIVDYENEKKEKGTTSLERQA